MGPKSNTIRDQRRRDVPGGLWFPNTQNIRFQLAILNGRGKDVYRLWPNITIPTLSPPIGRVDGEP